MCVETWNLEIGAVRVYSSSSVLACQPGVALLGLAGLMFFSVPGTSVQQYVVTAI